MYKSLTSVLLHAVRTGRSLLWTCAAVMLFAGHAQSGQALEFRKVSNVDACQARLCILASGVIDENAVDAFEAFVRTNSVRKGDVIVLDSPGGLTVAGMALGSAIRNARLSTTVEAFDRDGVKSDGKCTSACVFAFLGGVERTVANGGQIGVHQMATYAGTTMSASDAQFFTSLICAHVAKMGGTISMLVAAFGTPPERMHFFTSAELVRNGLVTLNIVRSRVKLDAAASAIASSINITTRY